MAKGKKAAARVVTKTSTSTSSSSLSPIAKARKDLQDGISTHTAAIMSMKHKLNELISIACLPPELLAEIFMHYAASERAAAVSTSARTYPYVQAAHDFGTYRWLRITHVCHHWRTVALASPRLWATIAVTHNVLCVREMVKRAKHAALDIRIGEYASRGALDDVLGGGKFAQVRRLEIPAYISEQGSRGGAFPTELIKGTESAPKMRALCIRGANAKTLEAFEKCAMPNLEELELVGAFPKWTSPLLVPGLTKLVLLSGYVGVGAEGAGMSGVPQSITGALDALENMPLLEHFELRNISLRGLESAEFVPPEERVVPLANLKVLHISDDAVACVQLLRCLSFPTSTSLMLDCRASSHHVEPIGAAVASKLSGGAASGPAPTLLTACFSTDAGRNIRLKCWTTEHDASPTTLLSPASSIPPPLFDIHLTLRSCLPVAFSTLFGCLPLSDLKSLVVKTDGYEMAPKDTWVRCCENMLSLRSLCVGRWAEEHLADVLASRIPLGTAEPTKKGGRRRLQPFLPALEVLRLEGVRMKPFYYDPNDKLLGKFRRAFEKRRKAKHPLAELVVWGCYNVRAGDVKALEGTVGKVVWDGQDKPPPPYEEELDEDYGDFDYDLWEDEMLGMDMEEEDEDFIFPWAMLPGQGMW